MAGQEAKAQCFDLAEFGVIPADVDGTLPPPAGSVAYAMSFTRDALQLWRIRIDWNDPKKSSMTGPTRIPVARFDIACENGPCIPQKPSVKDDPSSKLDAMGDRLMYRLVYRNFGKYEALLANHSIHVGENAKPASGIRWYEIRSPGKNPRIEQQSTYAIDSTARWMASMAMDKKGNLLVGYSASSSTGLPAIRLAGRSAKDAKGTLSKEIEVATGKVESRDDRWGDYSNMSVDPRDDCMFWFTTQYMGDPNPDKAWQTRIVRTKFKDCQ